MSKLVKAETAEEAQNLIERSAKEKVVATMRHIETMEIGKVVRQGDIYIHRVADGHTKGDPTGNRQLALGDSTGSRHVAEKPCQVYEGLIAPPWYNKNFAPLLGPCVASVARFVITHPEHAHVELPAGTYQITHQLDARTNTRAID
jgi:hypothetical protein